MIHLIRDTYWAITIIFIYLKIRTINMGKNLLAKIGLSAFMIAAPFVYSGCQVAPTTYEEKQQYLENRLDERNRTGSDSPIIVPLLKLESKDKSNN